MEQACPLVSILITCFNQEATIERALNSAIAQDYPNTEIIVVDDFSNDNSKAILKMRIGNSNKVKLIENSNNFGYGHSLNVGASHAVGDFIAIFDGDDVSDINRVSSQMRFAEQFSPDPVIIYSGRKVINASEVSLISPIKIDNKCCSPKDLFRYIFFGEASPAIKQGPFGSCTVLCSKSCFIQHEFNPRLRRFAEWDWVLRQFESGAKIGSVEKPLITQNKTSAQYKSDRVIAEQIRLLRRENAIRFEGHFDYLQSLNLGLAFHHYNKSRFAFGLFFKLKAKVYGYLHAKT